MALVQAVWKGNQKAVHLLRWAGADWHIKVPLLEWRNPETPDNEEDLRSAAHTAVGNGDGTLLKILPLDPARDAVEEMWTDVRDAVSVDCLFAVGPPTDWSPAILRNLALIANNVFTDWTDRCRQCLQRIAFHGGRLTSADASQRTLLRQAIIRMDRSDARRWLLYWLSNPRHCDPDIYADLVRTPKMREILGASGLGQPACKGRNVR